MAGGWEVQYDEPLDWVTNFTVAHEAIDWYRKRYRIETFFSDHKSRGLPIHKRQLSDPHAEHAG